MNERHARKKEFLLNTATAAVAITLFALFLGLKFAGVAGLSLFPLIALVITHLNDTGKIRLWKYQPLTFEQSAVPPHPRFPREYSLHSRPGASRRGRIHTGSR